MGTVLVVILAKKDHENRPCCVTGILIVYLNADAGNVKREDFYLLRNLPLFFK